MKRRIQVLALCAAFMAARLMAQDAGGGSGGATDSSGATDNNGGATTPDNNGGTTMPDNSGATSTSGGSSTSGATDNTSAPSESPAPSGTGDQGDNGMGTTTPSTGELPNAGGNPSGIVPPTAPSLFPGEIVPLPGETPAPFPSFPGANPAGTGTSGFGQSGTSLGTGAQEAPVTFTLPGGYGNPGSQSFTLGEGRLAKPPITFTASGSLGYDTNVFNADASIQPTPTPIPGPTPRLERRIIGYFIGPPTIRPLYQYFRPAALPTPTPAKTLGVLGSAVTSASVGVQVQHGTPRTIITLDLNVGEQEYLDEPGSGTDYNGNFDLAMVHRISPRATLSLESTASYQNTPNFALINAPTNNNNGSNYLDGNFKADLTYAWGSRVSTDTSAQVNFNLLNTNASSNLYQFTYATSFRYNVSARNTVSFLLQQQQTVYPTNATANSSGLFYLLGLDTIFSTRITNHIEFGVEQVSYPFGGSQTVPYMDSATTLALPHEGSLSWTNEYGSQASGSADVNDVSYRTGLNISQPLSTKLVLSLSIAYNYLISKNTSAPAGDYTQNQLQTSLSLGYNLTPRLSLSLSYNYIDFLTSQINSSYLRQQIYLGGSYTFK
jgi:hypothetical protein